MNHLIDALKIVNDHHISLTENDVFDLLKIKRRWPLRTTWDSPSVEIISETNHNSILEFYNWKGEFMYDKWKQLYDLGFTTIISNVLDLTSELRELDKKLSEHIGNYLHANFYFSPGTDKRRVSFGPHKHEYHVIVKPIYGKSTWHLGNEKFETNGEAFFVPMETMHCVTKCSDKKLSLTINL